MNIQTNEFEVFGVTVDVDYTAEFEKDPYGTGDSPSTCTIQVVDVYAGDIRITDIVDDYCLAKLEDIISEYEWENS